MSAKKSVAPQVPFFGGRCYACDAKAVGLTRHYVLAAFVDELACKRHADPSIKVYDACMFCNGPVRKGSVEIDGNFAHAKCMRAESK
jgi:hypothetical protein